MYFRFEGAEYESAFAGCGKEGTWHLEGGVAFDELVSIYRGAELTKYGELFVVLDLDVEYIDKNVYPNSHYTAIGKVEAVLAVTEGRRCKDA